MTKSTKPTAARKPTSEQIEKHNARLEKDRQISRVIEIEQLEKMVEEPRLADDPDDDETDAEGNPLVEGHTWVRKQVLVGPTDLSPDVQKLLQNVAQEDLPQGYLWQTNVVLVPDDSITVESQPAKVQQGRGRPRGKRSDPSYERVTVLLRKNTRKTAERNWNDNTGKDLSELLEWLLSQYLADPTIFGRPVGNA